MSLSVQGLSNISTTLDPTWHGLSIITITNLSQIERQIKVDDKFVTLNLEYVYSRASKNGIEKAISRTDLIKNFASDEEWSKLKHLAEMSVEDLTIAMKKSDDYKTISDQKWTDKVKNWLRKNGLTAIIALVIVGIILLLFN